MLVVRPSPAVVLGTRIFDLDGGERPTVVVSDLHVPADGGQVFAWLGTLLASAGRERARVLVLGDLFDSYVSPAQLQVGIWREIAARFAAATAQGAQIAVLHGNRDFLLGDEWTRATGAVVVPGGLRTVLAGRRTLLLHGDELCQNDLPYQRAKRWLRRPWVRGLARRLPLRTALWVAERARRRSMQVIRSGDQSRFLPTRAAIATALACDVEHLVFGHIHRLALGTFGTGEYRVLPAFDRDGVRLQVGAEVAFVDARGAAVAAAQATPLSLT